MYYKIPTKYMYVCIYVYTETCRAVAQTVVTCNVAWKYQVLAFK